MKDHLPILSTHDRALIALPTQLSAGPLARVLARGSTLLRALSLCSVALVLSSCAEDEEVKAEPLLRSVRHVVVTSNSGPTERTYSGALRAGTASRLSFQVAGKVQQVWVKVGQSVKKGDKLAALDPTDFSLQLQEAQASLAQAQAQATSARASYERVSKLYANNNASRQDLDTARAQRDGATSAANAGVQGVRRLQRQLGYTQLAAPAAGSISELNIEVSEVVAAGQVAAVLQVGDQLDVAVDVPGAEVTRISEGDKVAVRIDVQDGAKLPGIVSEIGVPKQGSTVFPVTVRLEEKRDDVRAGMAAEVTFQFATKKSATAKYVLPTTAVGEDRDGRYIYLLGDIQDGVGIVRRKPVEVGEIGAKGLAIVSGVSDGDRVVTAGVARIHDGLKVRVPEAKKPARGKSVDKKTAGGKQATGEKTKSGKSSAAAKVPSQPTAEPAKGE